MVALAGDKKIAGEIVISGNSAVLVNGEAAKSGRTVFSSSTIVTPADASAVVSVKGVGKIKISPNTKMIVNFDEDNISGSIQNGKLTVLNSKNEVSITAPNGKTAALSSGDSVVTADDHDDSDSDDGSSTLAWVGFMAVLAGAGVIFAIAAASDNNRVDLGGGTTTVSSGI